MRSFKLLSHAEHISIVHHAQLRLDHVQCTNDRITFAAPLSPSLNSRKSTLSSVNLHESHHASALSPRYPGQ